MSLIHSDYLKALDYSFAGGPFCDIVAKAGLGADGSLDYGFAGGPFASLAGTAAPPSTIEEDLEAGAGVNAAMVADHLVEGVAPGTGVQAVVDAVITQLDVPVTAAAGVEATFEDEWLDFTKDIDGGAGLGFSVEGDNISLYRDLLANTGINVEFEGVSLVDVLDLAFGTEAEFAGAVESGKAVTAGTGSTAEFSGKNLDGHADAGIGVNVAVDGYALTDALSAGAGSQAAMQRFAEYNRAVTAACGTLAILRRVQLDSVSPHLQGQDNDPLHLAAYRRRRPYHHPDFVIPGPVPLWRSELSVGQCSREQSI